MVTRHARYGDVVMLRCYYVIVAATKMLRLLLIRYAALAPHLLHAITLCADAIRS